MFFFRVCQYIFILFLKLYTLFTDGIKNVAKHFGFKDKSIKALKDHVNTGEYVKSGILKDLRIDTQDLKVQRLEQTCS